MPKKGYRSVKMIKLRPGALEQLRKGKEWGVGKLATAAEVSRQTIYRIEQGKAESVTLETINKLARALGQDADVLVTFDR